MDLINEDLQFQAEYKSLTSAQKLIVRLVIKEIIAGQPVSVFELLPAQELCSQNPDLESLMPSSHRQ